MRRWRSVSTDWVPLLSYGFVLYFGLEAFAWLIMASMRPSPANVFAGSAGSAAASLAPKSVVGDLCMTIMAASMGYMFAGMQLMMSMPQASEQIVQHQQLAPPQKTGDSSLFEAGQQVPESAPNMPPNRTARLEAETPPSSVNAGVILRRLAGEKIHQAEQTYAPA